MGLKSLFKYSPKWNLAAGVTLVAAGLMFGPPAHAALTLNGTPTGISNYDLTDTTKPIIYGGFTDGCTSDGANNTSTCDSCVSTTVLNVCNKTNAYANLIVTFSFTTTVAGFTVSDLYIEGTGTGAGSISNPINTPVVSDGQVTVQLTWNEICTTLLGFGSNGCDGSGGKTGEIKIGLKNSSSDENITVVVRVRNARGTTSSTYVDCGGTNPTAAAAYGLCHFSVFKGDEKLYADDVVTSDGYPTSTLVSGIPYTDVLFFYEGDPAGADDNALVAKINSKSPFVSIGVNQTTKKMADNRISGLTNGTRYCTLAGNRDASGIISHYTPLPSVSGGGTVLTDLCETPTKVVGLLDDKNCFIATAAFGSSMAPEVESFREYRNHFLLTNPLGKAFVKFYYKHSPYYANLIAESEGAKAVVRAALWPVLLFARVSLVFGVWMTVILTAASGLVFFEVYRRFFLGRRVKGEL